jgi:glycosyltransferase involved in cell wall biosynthesis
MSAAAVAPLPLAGVERLRVLQVIGALYFGGAERVAANIAIGIDGDRFDMAVCCTRGLGPLAERVTAAGVPVAVAGPQTRLHRYLTPWHVRKAIRRFRPHVVHTHGLPGLAEIGPLACLRQVPRWVHTFHFGNYPYQNTRHMAMERLFGRAADRLIAVSENQRASLAKHHGFALDSILTIPNGIVDVGCRETANSLAAKRAELGLPSDAFVIGSVAVLSEQKGISFLLKAATRIRSRMPAARFVIVGGGPLERQLRAECAELGLDDVVLFTGWRADVPELLPLFDVWVMSSLWEAMPLALVEAMSARRAIVATDVGDNRLMLGGGEAGRVIPPGDGDALAAAVLDLATQPEERAALAALARRRFEQHYTVTHMVQRYEQLYGATA